MYRVKNPKVGVEDITPSERQKKVRKIMGKLKRGSYTLDSRVVDDKTIENLGKDVV